jgi:hypothetical protein
MRWMALGISLGVLWAGVAQSADEPRREDRGDLIVLHLYGSYREMGRQQAELMGPELRAVYELHERDFERAMARAGSGEKLVNGILMPLWSGFGPLYEESGFHDEMTGIAAGLGVRRRQLMRVIFTLTAGSTVFAATGGATADGQALIGRNVDWQDGFGRRRPLVAHYHPTGDDLDYIFVGWPLVSLPTVGLNQAGFALSFNFFVSEPRVGYALPQWPHRLALQRATSVEEGIQIFEETRLRGISAFMVMADAAGDIAMVECIPEACSVFRPEGDWFGQANHARTQAMIPYDRYRGPDSFARRAAMEAAVRPYLGELSPLVASRILRDRANSPYANASTVANLTVLNAAVVHPASGILWHSTSMQPHAPFGEYVPFSLTDDAPEAPVLPVDPAFAAGELQAEVRAVAEARLASRLVEEGLLAEATVVLDRLAEAPGGPLDPARLAWARARVRWMQGQLEAAYEILAAVESPAAPYGVRARGLTRRAVLADRLGRRDEALRLYGLAAEHLAARPEFNVFDDLHPRIAAGLEAPQTDGDLTEGPELMLIPH